MCEGLEDASNGEYQGLEFYQRHGQKSEFISLTDTVKWHWSPEGLLTQQTTIHGPHKQLEWKRNITIPQS